MSKHEYGVVDIFAESEKEEPPDSTQDMFDEAGDNCLEQIISTGKQKELEGEIKRLKSLPKHIINTWSADDFRRHAAINVITLPQVDEARNLKYKSRHQKPAP